VAVLLLRLISGDSQFMPVRLSCIQVLGSKYFDRNLLIDLVHMTYFLCSLVMLFHRLTPKALELELEVHGTLISHHQFSLELFAIFL
jgi:hypothetical protein